MPDLCAARLSPRHAASPTDATPAARTASTSSTAPSISAVRQCSAASASRTSSPDAGTISGLRVPRPPNVALSAGALLAVRDQQVNFSTGRHRSLVVSATGPARVSIRACRRTPAQRELRRRPELHHLAEHLRPSRPPADRDDSRDRHLRRSGRTTRPLPPGLEIDNAVLRLAGAFGRNVTQCSTAIHQGIEAGGRFRDQDGDTDQDLAQHRLLALNDFRFDRPASAVKLGCAQRHSARKPNCSAAPSDRSLC